MSTLHKEAQGKQLRLRIRIENITITLLAVFSLFLFILTFFPFSKISQTMQVSFEMGRMVQRAFSIILFVLSLQLWKRKRNAWSVAMFIFVLNFLRGLIGMGHPMHNVLMLFDLLLFILFFFFRKDFCCPAGRENRRQTELLVLLAIAGVLANAGITWHYMRLGMDGNESVLFLKVFHKVLARCLVWVISQHPWSISTERNWFFSGSAGAVSLPQFFSPCVHGFKSRHMAFRNFSMHVHF